MITLVLYKLISRFKCYSVFPVLHQIVSPFYLPCNHTTQTSFEDNCCPRLRLFVIFLSPTISYRLSVRYSSYFLWQRYLFLIVVKPFLFPFIILNAPSLSNFSSYHSFPSIRLIIQIYKSYCHIHFSTLT